MAIQSETLYKILGGRIKNFRSKNGLTQIQLAEKLDMSRASIANIEAGHQNTPLHVLYDLSIVLNVPLKDLIPNVDEVYRSPQDIANVLVQEMSSDRTNLSLAATALSKAARSQSKGDGSAIND